jgi:hypothetical protein
LERSLQSATRHLEKLRGQTTGAELSKSIRAEFSKREMEQMAHQARVIREHLPSNQQNEPTAQKSDVKPLQEQGSEAVESGAACDEHAHGPEARVTENIVTEEEPSDGGELNPANQSAPTKFVTRASGPCKVAPRPKGHLPRSASHTSVPSAYDRTMFQPVPRGAADTVRQFSRRT